MLFIVKGTQAQLEQLKKSADANINWMLIEDLSDQRADAYFFFDELSLSKEIPADKPVFVNSVILTLREMNLPSNALRINGWPTFLERRGWEIAGNINDAATDVLKSLNKEILPVADEPGLIAATIIAAIINEAFFALQESVSSRDEIDAAMKLGTNYPYGPFEWAEKIGLKNVHQLLLALSKTDERYFPADLLTSEATSL